MGSQSGSVMRVAQIGCGQISAAHLQAYAASPLVELVAVVDVDETAARETAAAHGGVPWSTRFEDVLERPDVDLVSIATPHHLHAPQTVAAARAGKHVLCEKPLTTTLSAAQEMIDACRGAGVTLGMWFVARYTAPVRMARTLLRAGAIGEIVNIRLPDVHNKVQDYYQRGVGGRARPSEWRGGRATSGGGALIMNAIHQIDALRFVTGLEVTRISAEWVNFTGLAEVEDMIAVLLRYSNGAIGTIDTANYAPGGGEPPILRLYGTIGQLQLTGRGLRAYVQEAPAAGERATGEGAGGEESIPDLTPGEWQDVPLPALGDSRTLLLEDYVRAVQAGREPSVSGADGKACLATVLGAYESAASGSSVVPGA
jgi:UDP-N-acetyl-2-amino-2-deoxyglucuronate dehydrogenase